VLAVTPHRVFLRQPLDDLRDEIVGAHEKSVRRVRICSTGVRSGWEATDDERSQRPARVARSCTGASGSSYSDARPRAIVGQP
jgi:hypothetical protein